MFALPSMYSEIIIAAAVLLISYSNYTMLTTVHVINIYILRLLLSRKARFERGYFGLRYLIWILMNCGSFIMKTLYEIVIYQNFLSFFSLLFFDLFIF